MVGGLHTGSVELIFLCSCLCFFVSFEDARVVYLPNSVCVILQCYVSDEVLSSYYWNDNSSFPESKRRGEGGTSPHDPLLCSSSILTLILSAHGCWSPQWCFPDAWELRANTAPQKTKTHCSSFGCSLKVPHTLPVSLAAHCCSVKETLPQPRQRSGHNWLLNKELALPTSHFIHFN